MQSTFEISKASKTEDPSYYVNELFEGCVPAVQELVNDAEKGDFKNIRANSWYNAASSIVAIVMRAQDLKGKEKLQERVAYLIIEKILSDPKLIKIDDIYRKQLLDLYKLAAPSILDILIPSGDCCSCWCFSKCFSK